MPSNVPEDLQNWYNVAVRERTSDIKHIYTAEDCITLIERIATAEQEAATLRAIVRESRKQHNNEPANLVLYFSKNCACSTCRKADGVLKP